MTTRPASTASTGPTRQPSDARYPGYSGSQPGPSGQLSSAAGSGQPVQPSRRGQQGPVGPGGSNAASGPNGFGGQPVGNPGRASLPNAIGAPSGQYPAQQPRHRQPRPQSQPPQSQAATCLSRHCLRHRSPSHRASPPSRNSRRRAARAGTARAGGQPGRQRTGQVAARQHRAEPLRVGGHGFLSLSQPALPGPPRAVRQPDERRTQPWTDATGVTLATTGTTGRARPGRRVRPGRGTTATAPRAIAATDPFPPQMRKNSQVPRPRTKAYAPMH